LLALLPEGVTEGMDMKSKDIESNDAFILDANIGTGAESGL